MSVEELVIGEYYTRKNLEHLLLPRQIYTNYSMFRDDKHVYFFKNIPFRKLKIKYLLMDKFEFQKPDPNEYYTTYDYEKGFDNKDD